MQRRYFIGALLFAVMTMMVACSDDDSSTEKTSDCYITAINMGYLKRTIHTYDSEGNDSTYQASFSGAYYRLLIDQRSLLITNKDFLPVETSVNKVLLNITASGTVTYSYDPNAEEWTTYSESDSLSLEQPMYLRAYANNGLSYRQYTLIVNIRTNDFYCYTWGKQTDIPTSGATLSNSLCMRATTMFNAQTNNIEPVLVSMAADSSVCFTRGTFNTQGEISWTSTPCVETTHADVTSLQNVNDTLWLSTSCKTLLRSVDGINWVEVPQTQQLNLIACSEDGLYAAGEDGVYVSFDAGSTWNSMDLELDFSNFPKHTASVTHLQTNGSQRIYVAGETASTTTSASLWSYLEKLIFYRYDDPWTYFNPSLDNGYPLPLLKHLTLLSYNNDLWALGGASKNGTTHTALGAFYKSLDGGITWIPDDYLTVPTAYYSIVGTTAPIAACVNYDKIWLFVGNEVYTIRANNFGEIIYE